MLRSNIEHVFDKRGISEFDKVEMENDSMDDNRNVLTEGSDLQLFVDMSFHRTQTMTMILSEQSHQWNYRQPAKRGE